MVFARGSPRCARAGGNWESENEGARADQQGQDEAGEDDRRIEGDGKLTEDELGLYREWIENNRELERLVKEMRRISSRVLALITGRQAP